MKGTKFNKENKVKSMSQVKWDAGKWSKARSREGGENEISVICVGFKKNDKQEAIYSTFLTGYA
jgi:hypothetical protein